jgi:uncharacterized membrane protein YbaN (DUF454 family)
MKSRTRFSHTKSAQVKKNRRVFGILLIILGVVGLVLPVLPGWAFILAGLSMM